MAMLTTPAGAFMLVGLIFAIFEDLFDG